MKKLYFLLLAFSFFSVANAQIVNIRDANFKARLLEANTSNYIAQDLSGTYFKIDANNDGQIQVNEALKVYILSVNGASILDLTGIQSFVNLKHLSCVQNKLLNLDVSQLVNLKELFCSANQITTLNVSPLINLEKLFCYQNQISTLNVAPLVNLRELYCYDNQLTTLNVAPLVNLKELYYFKNQISTLDVTPLLNLESLDCSNNGITSLNLNNLTKLTSLSCAYNKLQNLNVTTLINLKTLSCRDNQLTSLNLTGLNSLILLSYRNNSIPNIDLTGQSQLEELYCSGNKITNFDFSILPKLKKLYCDNNLFEVLNINGLDNLKQFDCGKNKLSSLDVSNLTNLEQFNCTNNLLTSINLPILNQAIWGTSFYLSNNLFETLELSGNNSRFFCDNLPNLKYLFTKNINFSYIGGDYFSLEKCPNINYVCCNENNVKAMQSYFNKLGYSCNVNSYCSFVPGGTFYTIQGNQKLDSNKNGCDVNDFAIPNLKYNITNGTITGSLIPDSSGNYSIPVQAGTHTITPVLENPTYFTVSPTTVNVTFPTQTSPFTQNFCITANGVRPDLEVTLLPIAPARPGFDAKYKLVYKNKGNAIQSGAVNLTFNDAVLDLVVGNPVATSQNTNTLSWNFTNLQAFETREISFTMNVNSPMETPAVNNGDVLKFSTAITSVATDETPTDNTFTFNQTVVGSYDPNDKTCLEGNVISPNLIGQYVHYTIRFENNGTFAAENVVVKDMIDLAKFDVATLVPTSASHSYTTRITDKNKVEFIFENINLPFDDANNDGYIAFKIKTLPTLKVNDSFSNEASIFFDYNFPILTKPAVSTFKTLSTADFNFDHFFTIYPNPVKNTLNITSKESINTQSINVYNTLGQLVLVVTNASKVSSIDVSSLKTGNYFLQIKTDKGTSSSQFLKE